MTNGLIYRDSDTGINYVTSSVEDLAHQLIEETEAVQRHDYVGHNSPVMRFLRRLPGYENSRLGRLEKESKASC